MSKHVAQIEVLVKTPVFIKKEQEPLSLLIEEWLKKDLPQLARYMNLACLNNGNYYIRTIPEDLQDKIEKINLNCKSTVEISSFDDDNLFDPEFKFYFYKHYSDVMTNNIDEDLPSTFHTLLPSLLPTISELWDNLIFDDDIREKLLKYVMTSLLFGKHNVNQATITWNKVILLHGPPGTGKTSLCKALAQKLSIRLYNQYDSFQLIEINSHSLFSKWFSESGKLVLKLFDDIRAFAEDGSNLVFVLIDEVESLAYDRQKTNSSDPTDAVRVVNALLTQIDSVKRYPNVIILASSNVAGTMDNAFLDRVDIKQYIGVPSTACVYQIYQSCIQELVRSRIVSQSAVNQLMFYNEIHTIVNYKQDSVPTNDDAYQLSRHLLDIAQKSKAFSGRTLRKLPFLAIALDHDSGIPVDVGTFISLLDTSVSKQLEDNSHFSNIQ